MNPTPADIDSPKGSHRKAKGSALGKSTTYFYVQEFQSLYHSIPDNPLNPPLLMGTSGKPPFLRKT